jgi:hypothetical protein
MAIGVKYLSVPVFGHPDIREVIQMDMPVDEIFWLKNPHEPEKSLKTPVAGIVFVMNAPGRGMGEEDVQKTAPEDPVKDEDREEPQNLQIHLEIGKLIFSPVIPHGTSQSRDDKPFFPAHPGTDMNYPVAEGITFQGTQKRGVAAPFEVAIFLEVMVTEHEEQGFIEA